MSDHSQLAILICEPQGPTDENQFDNARPYLPYMWATLKTYRDEPSSGHWYDSTWPTPGTADTTTWTYDPARGARVSSP